MSTDQCTCDDVDEGLLLKTLQLEESPNKESHQKESPHKESPHKESPQLEKQQQLPQNNNNYSPQNNNQPPKFNEKLVPIFGNGLNLFEPPQVGKVWKNIIINKLKVSFDKSDINFIDFIRQTLYKTLGAIDTVNVIKCTHEDVIMTLDFKTDTIILEVLSRLSTRMHTDYFKRCKPEKHNAIIKYFYLSQKINLSISIIERMGQEYLTFVFRL